MSFDFRIDLQVWILILATITACIWAFVARFVPMIRIIRKADSQISFAEEDSEEAAMVSGKYPKVSVVVYTYTREEELLGFLQSLMTQNYPNYEVILVNDGSIEVTAELSDSLKSIYPDNLYVTFIPPGSHNLSRRKLALTLGIKAAKGEIILTTASNCIIPSSSWLSDMMKPFLESSVTEVVLGYSHIDYENMYGPGKWYREFDDVLTGCQWLGEAINDNPYRGDGNNLAYRRRIFFEQKGYSKTIHLVNGDDDIFVNEIANDFNTEVVLTPESILTVDWGEASNRIYADLKERYQFTSAMLPFTPFLRSGCASLMQWIATLAAAGAILFGLPNLLPTALAGGFLLLLLIMEMVIYTKAAHRLGANAHWQLLPLFLLWHPLGNMFFRLRHRRHRKKNFTFA